jgi:prephenate dehydratase
MFFVDREGHADDPPVAEALAGLATHCEALRTLGTYPMAA